MFVTSIRADEMELLREWQLHRRTAALEQLIEIYRPRIKAWARRGGYDRREDLVSEGLLALVEAAHRIKPEAWRKLSIATYGAILRERARMASLVSIPERQLRDAFAGRLVQSQADMLLQALHHEPFDELTSDLCMPNAEEGVILRDNVMHKRCNLARALRGLNKIERRLILHPLLRGDKRIETVAAGLGITCERARNLQSRALHKMRTSLILNGFTLEDFYDN